MINRRSDQLIREIAILLAKYKPNEWVPLLSELQRGSEVQARIGQALEELLAKPPKPIRRRPAKKITRSKAVALPLLSEKRRDILEPLRTALANRRILTSARSLREVFYNLGIKEPMPTKRAEAVDSLMSFLDQVDDINFQESVMKVTSFQPSGNANFEGEYRRWFDMILQSGQ